MKKINTKKYVYIVVETRVDDFGYYDSYEEVFKSESKAREVYMEKRKSILQDWQTRDIDLTEITNKEYEKKDNYYVTDYTNKLNIKSITGDSSNYTQLKFIKVELK